MKIAVTGGSGELGSLVLERLAFDRKIKKVVSLDLRPPIVPAAKIEAVSCDIRDPAIADHFAGCDAVVHLAFIVADWLPREEFDAINIGGSINVFEAAARAGVKHVVYTSSLAAYGVTHGHPVPIVETTPRIPVPEFPYSHAKFAVEEYLDDRFEPAHPDVVVTRLRPGIVVGERMEHALGAALRRRFIVDLGGDTPMQLVWDEDVADAIVLAVKKRLHGAFNLGAAEAKPIDDVARAAGLRVVRVPISLLTQLAKAGPLIKRSLPPSLRKKVRTPDPAWLVNSRATMVMSSEKARRELGWRPSCDTCLDVIRRHAKMVPIRTDPRIALFLRMADLAARSAPISDEARRVTAKIHLHLTGSRGGDFTIDVDLGRIRIARGVPRPPTSTITMTDRTFLDLLGGGLDVFTAQTTGMVRLQGEPIAGMVLGGLVSTFRTGAERKDAYGMALRGLSRWFERGRAGAGRDERTHA